MSNVFSCTGIIGADAELRYTSTGQAVLNVTIANHVGFGDRQKTVWLQVALWGKRAEGKLKDYLKKGQPIFVSGELSIQEYKAKDGTQKTSLELNASVIDLIGKKVVANDSHGEKDEVNDYIGGGDPFDDGIPF